jgi:predicted TIM-barrel fold metal-dependent hydrolase
MLDDIFVINPVAHAYNLLPENIQDNVSAASLRDMLIGMHATWNPPGVGLGADEQQTDWPIEVLAKTLFLEADVDLAAFHTLRLDSYMKDGLCRHEKTLEAVSRYPDRFLGYVGVDPTAGLEVCLRELDEQLDDIPDPVGLKLYPSQVAPYRFWRMDDPTLAYPLFERAQERGIKSIAIHKAAPLGPVPMDPYRIDDVEGAAGAFPDINFEIIHSGLAFVTETAWALARYPNIYANFEITSSLIVKAPRMFESVLGEFLMWGGPEKLIFSDGSMVFHSQPILERIRELELSQETLETFGIEQWDHEQKRLFLGGNYARINGIDIDARKAAIVEDEFSRARREHGLAEPYSHWRSHLQERGELVGA